MLGPLLFLIYINDLPNISDKLEFFLFADDTNIYYESNDLDSIQRVMNDELKKLQDWLITNKLALNISKTNFTIFSAPDKPLISRAIGIFYKIKNFVTKPILINLYYSLIYPFLIYAVHIWGGTSDNNLRPLHVLQKRDVRLITNNDSINPDGSRIHSSPLFYETGILTIYDIFKLQLAIFVFKCLNHYNPPQFSNYYSYVSDHYNTS